MRKAFTQYPILRVTVQIVAAVAICGPTSPMCAAIVSGATTAAITGIMGGSLSQSLRAGLISAATAIAFNAVGGMVSGIGPVEFGNAAHLVKIAGHAGVGCLSAMASGGKCGQGAASAAASAFGAPVIGSMFPNPQGNAGDFIGGTVASGALGGAASVAAGGKFATGAETAAFGYMFNHIVHDQRNYVDQFDIGNDAHRTLQDNRLGLDSGFFKEAYGHDGVSFGMEWLGAYGRVDLGNSVTKELWEIKSPAYINRGVQAIQFYTYGTPYSAGGLSAFGGATSLTLPGQFATYTYSLAAPGVITYDYKLKEDTAYAPSSVYVGGRASSRFPQPKPSMSPMPKPATAH